MKKRIIIGALALSAIFSLVAFRQPASASCSGQIYVNTASGYIFTCGMSPEEQKEGLEGFSIDYEKNKITLNNYDGGTIHYYCYGYGGSCFTPIDMEIELIGENKISSEYFNSDNADNEEFENSAFFNIVPNFTGSGSLKMEAEVPFGFNHAELAKSFSVDVIGSDFVKTANEAETNIPTDGKQEENKKTDTTESFFETTLGVALLIAVPSLLIIIIVILFVALINKGKNTPNNANNIPNNN